MTNVTPINKAPRLSEQDVHQAAQNLIDSGEVVSSLTLLKALGRGSLTTITKYMSTFNQGNKEDQQDFGISLFTELPETLSRSTKLLAIKIWTESQELANKELENQREVLQQAVKLSSERVKEAELFSDEQTKRMEEIEKNYEQEIAQLRYDLDLSNEELKEKSELHNQIVIKLEVLKNENNGLKTLVGHTKEQLGELKKDRDTDISTIKNDNSIKSEELQNELQRLREHSNTIQDQLHLDNNRLDLQVAKQQISLDLLCKRLEEEKQNRSADNKENKFLREKASLLEGELNTWKKMNYIIDKKESKL